MILTEIRVTNFRVYRGTQSLVLTPPHEERSVYLIGGLNGAGKTSLFSAVALGLYGEQAAGLIFERGRDARRAYEQYLEGSFSNGARAAGENEMRVALDATHEGEPLQIERTWWFDRGNFDDESLTIRFGGRPLELDGVESESDRASLLKDFLEELAPARVGKFFFFDGEEISTIAERQPSEAVVEGLNQLLGFQALTRTVADLVSLRRTVQRELPAASNSSLSAAMDELETLEAELNRHGKAVATDLEALEVVRVERAAIEGELNSLLGDADIRSRSDALDMLARLERELARVSAEIQGFVTEVLVLALPGHLLRASAQRARREAKARRLWEARRHLRSAREKVREQLVREARAISPKLTPAQLRAVSALFNTTWDSVVEKDTKNAGHLFSLLPIDDLERLQLTADDVTETARRELQARLNRRTHIEREIARIRATESLLESNVRVHALLETKSRLLDAETQAEARLATSRGQTDSVAHEVATKRALVTRLEDQLSTSAKLFGELETIAKLHDACRAFMAVLRRDRAQALAEKTTEMVGRLAHKEDLIARVELDPDTFEIRMFERTGDEVINLSAGEREVFALALVWALGQISSRELPVMIDTPLGRLDQMHRANVVRGFFPYAGSQVFILSTDSEIDERWHEALEDSIVQHITIEYDPVEQRSLLRDGAYFDFISPEQVAR